MKTGERGEIEKQEKTVKREKESKRKTLTG